MSRIDLERLVVRQRFYIPAKVSKLRNVILKELKESDSPIYDVDSWILAEDHARSFIIEYLYKHFFVKLKTSGEKRTKEYVKEIAQEYDTGFPETFFKTIQSRVGRVIDTLHVFIISTEENACICDVECTPNLHRRITQLNEKPEDTAIEDAYMNGRRFLKHIFESGLSSTLISEEKREPLRPTTELLINDQVSHQIRVKIEEMLDQATGEVLLCGWIGTLLLPKLNEMIQKGVNVRVITHKAKELKGQLGHQDVQRAFRELISMLGENNISIRPECHCRVIVVDNKALVGSMDLNAISLTGSHRELAIYTEDPEIVRNLRNYFNGVFSPLSKEKVK